MNEKERKKLINSYIGRTVDIKIDRPIGYIHHGNTYPVNYGYIPGVIGGDGEELDVYLLGVDKPVSEYRAKIIGAVHRIDDNEDKLVAAPEGAIFDQAQIAEQVAFQERYFTTSIEALHHRSCGAVIYRRRGDGIEYLCLFQRRSERYSFPKGHAEAYETELETAEREIKEEIGICAELDSLFREKVHYSFNEIKRKTVVLFLAEYNGELNVDSGEISEYVWADIEKAKELLPEWYEAVLEKADQYINR
ncbi:MAG: NUDIX domain-containing protein [Clostridia bacterium]|nr:NUDIX domain-containing protein [Clostridia bacterium]MBQ4602144.1 NUDIX domain-containing protein [Clostridia bacterium]